MTIELIVGLVSLILGGFGAYLLYLIKRGDAANDQKLAELKSKDEFQQAMLDSLKTLIEKQIKMTELNEQKDTLNLRLINKKIGS